MQQGQPLSLAIRKACLYDVRIHVCDCITIERMLMIPSTSRFSHLHLRRQPANQLQREHQLRCNGARYPVLHRILAAFTYSSHTLSRVISTCMDKVL